jgi:hypothetical protein
MNQSSTVVKSEQWTSIYLLTKRLIITYEETWFTIQIVMIHLFMI